MEYTVQIIQALAWPIAVVWLGYIFRSDVRKLLARLSNLKWKDAEASFGKEIEEAEKSTETVFSKSGDDFLDQEERLLRIAEISPRAGILEAWVEIETLSYKSGYVSGVTIPRVTPMRMIENLVQEKKLPKESVHVLQKLRKIRNEASHLPDVVVTFDEARKYIKMTTKVLQALK